MNDYKILYVLVDNEELNYYKELKLSVFSLKKHNPEKAVIVLVDNKTYKYIMNKDPEGLENFVQYEIVDRIEGYSNVKMSRWIKTNMRNLIEGDFFYIDTDTIICETFKDFPEDIELGMVYDGNATTLNDNAYKSFILKALKKFKFDYDINGEYFNSGVMYVKDTNQNRKFFEQWNLKWQYCVSKGSLADQHSLYITNKLMGNIIKPIDQIWNVQVTVQPFNIKLFNNAIILHSNCLGHECPFTLGRQETYAKFTIKDNEKMMELIENPKSMLDIGLYLYMNNEECSNYYIRRNSYLNRAFDKIFNNKTLFNVLNSSFGFFYELAHAIKMIIKKLKK